MSEAIGRVAALWRFPVKSMLGEQVPAAELTLSGVVGDRAYALVDSQTAKVVSAKSVPESALWIHDEANLNAAKLLADLWTPEFPIPVGVLTARPAPVYEDVLLEQERRAISDRGPGDIAKLLVSGDTWKIE